MTCFCAQYQRCCVGVCYFRLCASPSGSRRVATRQRAPERRIPQRGERPEIGNRHPATAQSPSRPYDVMLGAPRWAPCTKTITQTQAGNCVRGCCRYGAHAKDPSADTNEFTRILPVILHAPRPGTGRRSGALRLGRHFPHSPPTVHLLLLLLLLFPCPPHHDHHYLRSLLSPLAYLANRPRDNPTTGFQANFQNSCLCLCRSLLRFLYFLKKNPNRTES
jgi:hypothetical protein